MKFTAPKKTFLAVQKPASKDSLDYKTVILKTHTMCCWNSMHAHRVLRNQTVGNNHKANRLSNGRDLTFFILVFEKLGMDFCMIYAGSQENVKMSLTGIFLFLDLATVRKLHCLASICERCVHIHCTAWSSQHQAWDLRVGSV